MKKKAVLLLAGGEIQIPQVQISRDLGYHTIVTDRVANCACRKYADELVLLDTYDIAGHIALAQSLKERYDLRGIFTSGADIEHVVALTAASVGLPSVDPRSAYATHHKPRMREIFDKAGIPNARWAEVRTGIEAMDAAARIGAPLVIKNTDNCASRGTTLLYELYEKEVVDAFRKAKAASKSGTALMEQMFTGPEQTVETLIDGDKFYPCFVTDRRFLDKKSGYSVECGLQNPSSLSDSQRGELYAMVWEAAQALGIDFGAAKADTIWTPEGPRIIEMTCRLSGGFDCEYLVPMATGQEIVKAALLQACGEGIDPELIRPKFHKYAVSLNIFPDPGYITEISGIRQAGLSEGVQRIFYRYTAGDTIPPYEDCAARPVWILAGGNTAKKAWANATKAAAKLHIKTDGRYIGRGRNERS